MSKSVLVIVSATVIGFRQWFKLQIIYSQDQRNAVCISIQYTNTTSVIGKIRNKNQTYIAYEYISTTWTNRLTINLNTKHDVFTAKFIVRKAQCDYS